MRSRSFSTLASALDADLIGFIGLGNMGLPMASNLLTHGRRLLVFDMSDERLQEAQKRGAKAAQSVAHVAREARVVMTMLPATKHVKAVYLGETGLLANLGEKGSLIIDSSTIDPVSAEEVNKEATSAGYRMVDAPVSGGVPGAVDATLTFMVGGTDDNFKATQPLLAMMGKSVVHCGGPGKGAAFKVCNNLILAVSMLGVSEGFRLAESLGVDLNKFASVVNTSSGRCWSSDTYNPAPGVMDNVPASRDYVGGFAIDLMVKDLGLALSAAEVTKAPLPATKEAHRLYGQVAAKGHGSLDFGSVYKYGGT
ncbi:unnamed protein product [Vitrella brassicaformis CCMP3155]|uniref:3-hydroxyisobutyrate dehydrogenase n=1 Tax=Vitrella brassicaformis (strain CCMP3155) TaxID=1169540 RepID=A0A0G4EI02_VITBC|nr:unnamed protein product [Vitrella brassicaformis CCMP3155]|eukprot:CEL95590.1 unnamed protein product [Vitrella brassicaformis CCMP3155]